MKKKVTNLIFGEYFDKKIFDETGIFIIKNAIPYEIIKEIQSEWELEQEKILNTEGGRIVDKNNEVNYKNELPKKLNFFWRNEYVKKISTQVVGKNVALYNHRVVVKDKNSSFKVFTHQDFCYHVGFHSKSSLFIPIYDCYEKNGGLSFYIGSHQYGYLGDAGEINPEKFTKWEKVCPKLNVGDVAVMNSLTWHESGPNLTDKDRVLFDIIIQPSNDPSGKYLIDGEWETDFWIEERKNEDFTIDSLFVDCRSKKIKKLSQK